MAASYGVLDLITQRVALYTALKVRHESMCVSDEMMKPSKKPLVPMFFYMMHEIHRNDPTKVTEQTMLKVFEALKKDTMVVWVGGVNSADATPRGCKLSGQGPEGEVRTGPRARQRAHLRGAGWLRRGAPDPLVLRI